MEPLARAEQLAGVGRYREAMDIVEKTPRRDSRQYDLLRAQLYELFGQVEDARECAESVLAIKGLPDAERGRAEFVISRLEAEVGNLEAEFRHLQKAILHSERARDLKSVCTSQFQLLVLIADRSGQDSERSLMRQIRTNVTKLGDPATTAALHLFVSELDGKRGLLTSATNHILISKRLLESHHHLWLEAWAYNNLLSCALLSSDFDAAVEHGRAALSRSTECGAVAPIRRCLANLGHLYVSLGAFDRALDYLERAARYSNSSNEHDHARLDNIARVRLSQNNFEEGLRLIERVEANTQHPTGTGRYVHRHSLLTKAELLLSLKRFDDGLKCLNVTMELASQAGENALLNTAALLAFETKTIITPTAPVGTLPFPGPGASSGLSALAERVLATSLAQTGQPGRGRRHYERAARVHRALGNVPAQIELDRSWANTAAATADRHEDIEGDGGSATVMHSIAALLNHSGQPEILATEVIAILNHVGCTTGAVAVAREESGRETVLAAVGSPVAGPGIRAFTIGTARQRTIELRLQPLPDLEAQATVNSLALLLSTVGELEVARAEREQRLTLWPIDHLPSLDDSVILGEMATLMASARRIAAANVVVLITGESGTGKEVLARAIHGYSSRARKPFIPFNCTTIARELAESQLFGHRRGAFTGADRDAPGLVRSAKDGTLFLDEIGEMALELQPKLLRFLESGEISPLGDSSPFTVDVRIIAATNANLEALVEQGRFREDLYYRVNVVRLTIPPLRDRRDEIPSLVHHFVAKACGEFNKSGVRVAEETMEQLILYPWPGNVRQLQNELRRIVALADNDAVLTPVTLSRAIRQETASGPGRVAPGVEVSVPFSDKLAPTISRIERDMIKAALTASNGKLEAAAKALGISRKGLYLKRQRLGV